MDRSPFRRGAAGRSRTGTVSLPADFESATSANSITAANVTMILYNNRNEKSSLFFIFFPNIFYNAVIRKKRQILYLPFLIFAKLNISAF